MNANDVNYDIALSLDKASLVEREQANHLGSNELILDYNNCSNGGEEFALAWLSENRKSLTDPAFGFRTYEGTWWCVSIGYKDGGDIIRQRFKIDSSIGDLGVDENITPFEDQEGTIAKMATNEVIQKAYYWRIVDPNRIQLPDTAIAGEVWTKSNTENSDGTYDITVSRALIISASIGDLGDPIIRPFTDQQGTLAKMAINEEIQKAYYWSITDPDLIQIPEDEIDGEIWTKSNSRNGDGTYDVTVSRSINKPYVIGDLGVSIAITPFADQEGTITGMSASSTEETAYYFRIVDPDTIQIPDAPREGEIWDKRNRENSDGTFTITVTRRKSTSQEGNSDSELGSEGADAPELTDILISGGLLTGVNQYYEHTAGTIGNDDAVWTGRTDSGWIISNPSGTDWTINSATYGEESFRHYPNINASQWFKPGTHSSVNATEHLHETLIVQIGFNPKAQETNAVTTTSTDKLDFGTGVDDEPYPTVGQEKLITNVPNEDGTYRVTVQTTTVNEQRTPALTDYVSFSNNSTSIGSTVDNYNGERGGVITGKNATYARYQQSVNEMNRYHSRWQNSISVSLNKYGLYDYTIRSADI